MGFSAFIAPFFSFGRVDSIAGLEDTIASGFSLNVSLTRNTTFFMKIRSRVHQLSVLELGRNVL